MKNISLSEEKGFGLDAANVSVEKFPLLIGAPPKLRLRRIIE
jgi:KUP system potassium uptake protein